MKIPLHLEWKEQPRSLRNSRLNLQRRGRWPILLKGISGHTLSFPLMAFLRRLRVGVTHHGTKTKSVLQVVLRIQQRLSHRTCPTRTLASLEPMAPTLPFNQGRRRGSLDPPALREVVRR